jgi:hypothetical protein
MSGLLEVSDISKLLKMARIIVSTSAKPVRGREELLLHVKSYGAAG